MGKITISIDNDFIINKNLQGEVIKITIETTNEIYNFTNSNKDKNCLDNSHKDSGNKAMASIDDIFQVFK
ncbi:MAG: hypothetical protein J6D47_15945 [Peptostreptococcaceae bacterium]|nr:hypothetical protein [Peptostreptococcaceae bacterium]